MRILYCDGACENNGSENFAKAYGSCFDGETLHRWDFPEAVTNNEAEYLSLIYTLEGVALPGDMIRMDSMLVVQTSMGKWKVKAPNLIPYRDKAQQLIKYLGVEVSWVPREEMVVKVGH